MQIRGSSAFTERRYSSFAEVSFYESQLLTVGSMKTPVAFAVANFARRSKIFAHG